MAVEQYVFLDGEAMPTSEQLNVRAQELGLDFALLDTDPSASLKSHRGYLPVKFDGVETGFETYFMPVLEVADLPPEAAGWSHFAMTNTGGDFRAGFAATIYLRLVSDQSSGGYWYPDTGFVAPDAVQAVLDDSIEGFRAELERQAAKAARRAAREPQSPPPPPSQPLKGGLFSRLLGRK